jgi:predicted CxxxxCH...CXXCH cytochrome family protein
MAFALIACTGCLSGIEDTGEAPPNADPQAGCALACHGTDTSNAPPKSVAGAVDSTATAVGAHQQHLNIAATWHRVVKCGDCHVVPGSVEAPGHMDGDGRAEVTFASIAGVSAMWSGTTCTVACHGSTALGGTSATPEWTRVDGTQSTCGSCHGAPPPAPHPQDTNCASCHPTMEEGSLAFRDPASHINGVVDVTGNNAAGCVSCHGSPTSSAPPKDLAGNTTPTSRGVGAHAAHLAPSTWHRTIACTSCHTVPLSVDAPGHRDGDNLAEVRFDGLNPAGVYTAATATCSAQYCHGNGRGNTGTKSWVTPGVLACGGCHSVNGTGMSGEHRRHIVEENMRCSQCHGSVVDAAQTIIAPNLHVNGVHEIKMAAGTFNPATRACSNTGCHGNETW